MRCGGQRGRIGVQSSLRALDSAVEVHMGVSKSGDKFIMRETSHTDEIEGTTLAELAEWVSISFKDRRT